MIRTLDRGMLRAVTVQRNRELPRDQRHFQRVREGEEGREEGG